MNEFPLDPQEVAPVQTAHRTICTPIPAPDSVPLLQRLRELEARNMGGQPPVIWHHGSGATVSDACGNTWIDFSAGVLVTSSGHGHPRICAALRELVDQGLYHAFAFPTEIRLRLVETLRAMLPDEVSRIFLLATGSEATEFCIKTARTWGQQKAEDKNVFVSFDGAFHGRTMGAQLAGGLDGQKDWLRPLDDRFVQVPYPDGFRQPDTSFDVFERTLADKGIAPSRVCGVMSETYQGINACLMPPKYAQALRQWCDEHGALLIFDEVQAGCGRTGKPFGFNHFGFVPDLIALGKGLSGGLPISAVCGREELMSLYGPASTTSTHAANPLSCAAALANLEIIRDEKLIAHAAALAPVLADGCRRLADAAGGRIGKWDAVGLVGCVQFTKDGTPQPDPQPAWDMTVRAIQRGVMLFAPVGIGGCGIKINPPLVIDEETLREGLDVLEQIARELA